MYFLCIAVVQFFYYYYNFLFLKPDVCRILEFKSAMKGYNLHGHIFKSVEVQNETDCDVKCYLESDCISFNVVTSPTDGTITCELSNSDHETHPEDLRRQFGAVYQPIKVKGITEELFSIDMITTSTNARKSRDLESLLRKTTNSRCIS